MGRLFIAFCILSLMSPSAFAQPAPDPIRVLVQRLDLEAYKATIKSLTQFGDRRQGTSRNRAAIDWIETQLKSYGCTNTERLTYEFGAEPPHRVLFGPYTNGKICLPALGNPGATKLVVRTDS